MLWQPFFNEMMHTFSINQEAAGLYIYNDNYMWRYVGQKQECVALAQRVLNGGDRHGTGAHDCILLQLKKIKDRFSNKFLLRTNY